MPTSSEVLYWNECWPEALCNVLRVFMARGDAAGVTGLLSLAVCHRGTGTHAYEAAVSALVRQILEGMEEAERIKQELVDKELDLKAEGLYESRKKTSELLSRGLVPLPRLAYEVVGYKSDAWEIYRALKNAGFLTVEEHKIGKSGRKVEWVGLNADWNGLIEDIKSRGMSKSMWASSAGILLCMAVTGKGISTVKPMYIGVLAADGKGGEISYRDLYLQCYAGGHHQGKKALDIILERQREKVDPLKIWPSDDGRRLIVNPNTVYAVKAWRRETNRLWRHRGLGVI
ncbi:MAG: hypothetical protein ACE5NG_17905 [bacterium]